MTSGTVENPFSDSLNFLEVLDSLLFVTRMEARLEAFKRRTASFLLSYDFGEIDNKRRNKRKTILK